MTTVRYWAGARAAAGTATDEVEEATLADAVLEVVRRHGPALETVLAVCSFVVDGAPVGGRAHASVPLDGAELVDVLPPFAGG